MLPFKMAGASLSPFGQLAALPASAGGVAVGQGHGMTIVDHYRTQLLQDYTARLRYMVPSLPPGQGHPNPATLAALYNPSSAAAAGSPWAAYLAYAARQHATDPRLLRLACGDAADAAQRFLRLAGLPHEEPKPSQSYIGLIAMAILSSKEKKLVLSDIYQWILDHYPYFRSRGPGWRNSIRHNLSLNDCFIKCGRSANGKGHYWAVHPANVDDFQRGDFRRRRAQRKVRKAMGMIVPDDDDDDDDSPPLLLHGPPASSAGPPPPPALWSPRTYTPSETNVRPFTSPLSNCSPQSLTGVGTTPASWLQEERDAMKTGQYHLSPIPRDEDAAGEDADDRCSSPSVDIASPVSHPATAFGDKNGGLYSSSDISQQEIVTSGNLDLRGHDLSLFSAPPASHHVTAAPPSSVTLKRRLFDMESLLAPDDAPIVKMRMGSFLAAGDLSDLHSKVTPTTQTSVAAPFSV